MMAVYVSLGGGLVDHGTPEGQEGKLIALPLPIQMFYIASSYSSKFKYRATSLDLDCVKSSAPVKPWKNSSITEQTIRVIFA